MSWLSLLLEQVKEYESPTPFWYWSGLSTLSAIAKDRVWVERSGNLQVYLNIYVLLFGRSGIRKGPPINLAKELVKKIGNTRVISGRSSVEAIVEDLKEVQTDQARKTILTDSCGFIVSSEFSSGIVRSEQALTTLTNLYDRRYNEGAFDIRLIRTGKQTLKSPTITMLGGINEAHFQSFMEDKDITGGFLGRTFVIHANEKNRINSLMFEMENKIDEEKLLEHLKLVEKLKGPLIISDAGKVTYNAWYNDFYNANVEDKTGTHERIGDSALKIAGLLSLSNGISMEVTQKEIMTGIEMAEKLINSARHVTFTLHEEESLSTLKKKILKILVKRQDHKITARKLLAEMHGVMNADDLVKIGETLQQGGLIDIYMFGDNVIYEMKEEIVKKLQHAIGE